MRKANSSEASIMGNGRNGLQLSSENLAYAERMYQRWLRGDDHVPAEWRTLFEADKPGNGGASAVGPSFQARSIFGGAPSAAAPVADVAKQIAVLRLIDYYRTYGHQYATLDPLGTDLTPDYTEPPLSHFGLGNADLDVTFVADDFGRGAPVTLREIRKRLRDSYCRTVGVEFAHIQDEEQVSWLRALIETGSYLSWVTPEVEKLAAESIIRAEAFEKFLHKKFVGTKRFSLEGAESLISALDSLVEASALHHIETVIFGMAHRGRINVLANILHKECEMIFNEFEDIIDSRLSFGSGDVKYHLGFNNVRTTRDGREIWMSLTSNPSHLEAVNAVVEGRVRARQDRMGDVNHKRVLPVLIHGDAAFAGQGTVMETLNLAKLSGYRTGGTVHIVINNQIGFTTSPKDARSTLYCTDVAKMLPVPIFHVNGDDVRSLLGVTRMALEFRQRFRVGRGDRSRLLPPLRPQ
ncbi:MAG: thiamine pyrophosphate-dependent enzyme [Deltaproteobacteria bacterium]|nr:thiamine pyrophosphate-dependent enzyme [Deltaproteobacteria bacterium]